MSVITAIMCALVAAAFVHVNVWGTCEYQSTEGPDFEFYTHGWPLAFAQHKERANYSSPSLSGTLLSPSVRMISARAAVSDVLLSLAMCVAIGAVVMRLEWRLRSRLRVTAPELISLTAGAFVVLATALHQHLREAPLNSTERCSLIREYCWFDQAMMYMAIACSAALLVLAAIHLLSSLILALMRKLARR